MSRRTAIILGSALAVLVVAGGIAAALFLGGGIGDDADSRARIIVDRLDDVTERVEYQQVESNRLAGGITFQNMTVAMKRGTVLQADAVEVREFDWDNPGTPRLMDVRIRNLRVDPSQSSAGQELARDLTALLGINDPNVTTNYHYRYEHDPQNQTLKFELESEAEEMGQLSVNGEFGNIATLDVQGEQTLSREALGITLVRAKVSYSDQAYVDSVIQRYAEREGISATQAKARLLNDLLQQRNRAGSQFEREMLDALTQFLENPGELTFEAAPPTPVPLFSALMLSGSPDALQRRFGLSVSVTPGQGD